jgi:hypothetical protein
MSKKYNHDIRFRSLSITVFILLFSAGFNTLVSGRTVISYKFESKVSSISLLNDGISGQAVFCERNNNPLLPEELPVAVEEEEEDTNDDENNDSFIETNWSQFSYNYIQQIYSPEYYPITRSAKFLSIPLYILFHSRKDCLI